MLALMAASILGCSRKTTASRLMEMVLQSAQHVWNAESSSGLPSTRGQPALADPSWAAGSGKGAK